MMTTAMTLRGRRSGVEHSVTNREQNVIGQGAL
jgi:hypothetical protein